MTFSIGQIVAHKAEVLPWLERVPVRLLILESQVQTCPGGSQTHYVVRPVDALRGGFGELFHVNESELVPYPSQEDVATFKARSDPFADFAQRFKDAKDAVKE